MTSDDYLRALAKSHARATRRTDKLSTKSENELYAAIATLAAEPSGHASLATAFKRTSHPDELMRSNGVGTVLGRRIFMRWSAAFHKFVCSPGKEDEELRQDLIAAVFSKGAGSLAILTGGLVAAFGISPALATLVAALILRLIAAPALDETCKVWSESLAAKGNTIQARPRSTRPRRSAK